jgi:hypothetical protein
LMYCMWGSHWVCPLPWTTRPTLLTDDIRQTPLSQSYCKFLLCSLFATPDTCGGERGLMLAHPAAEQKDPDARSRLDTELCNLPRCLWIEKRLEEKTIIYPLFFIETWKNRCLTTFGGSPLVKCISDYIMDQCVWVITLVYKHFSGGLMYTTGQMFQNTYSFKGFSLFLLFSTFRIIVKTSKL